MGTMTTQQQPIDLLEEIHRVFQLEINTLSQVRDNLGQAYIEAARMLFQCAGQVVVTGMGKSGLIAQKIAATMVSTGTPAVFLDSGNGMHGDVGIIREGDVVLAISKSGETDELLNILLYIKSMGTPLISITANSASTLANNSDLVLFTPVAEEACPLDLAPTSSTTAALVVGDALALALMKMRDFRPENFARLHPGGNLGKRLLLTVADVMRSGPNNPVINATDTIQNMLYEITSKRTGAISVVDAEGQLLGLVTDYDIRVTLERGLDLFSLSITDIMNPQATYIFADEMAVRAFDMMENREKPFLVLSVLDRQTGKVAGMVHLHDLVAKGL
ncbi:MAG: SIS domain-containing protein [Dehalococcoidia bacterium]